MVPQIASTVNDRTFCMHRNKINLVFPEFVLFCFCCLIQSTNFHFSELRELWFVVFLIWEFCPTHWFYAKRDGKSLQARACVCNSSKPQFFVMPESDQLLEVKSNWLLALNHNSSFSTGCSGLVKIFKCGVFSLLCAKESVLEMPWESGFFIKLWAELVYCWT